jgi:hypothetical protein
MTWNITDRTIKTQKKKIDNGKTEQHESWTMIENAHSNKLNRIIGSTALHVLH